MCNFWGDNMDKISEKMAIPLKWKLIDKNHYEKLGIVSTDDSSVICSWFTTNHEEKVGVVTLYDFGERKGIMGQLEKTFKQIANDSELQQQYNIYPVHSEKTKIGKKQIFFCALKTKDYEEVSVDMYFDYESRLYSLHTVVDGVNGTTAEQIIDKSIRLGNIAEIIKSL